VGRGVFKGINPQGCNVWSFSKPSEEEQKHDFLWRYHYRVPEAGMIAIFNRSYYEGVLGDRVRGEVEEAVWRARYDQINDFERILAADKVTIVKFFLHISKDEQKRRLEERRNNPNKYWLLSESDIRERERWDEYHAAFEEAITRCNAAHAPWYIVPGNHKWYRNLVIARTIADTLEALDPQYPDLDPELADVSIPD
jgi:PPK2 family polyphosphate:nucleotide phosphotransferase